MQAGGRGFDPHQFHQFGCVGYVSVCVVQFITFTAISAKNQSGIHDVLRTHGLYRSVAQLVEYSTDNRAVGGSIPSTSTIMGLFWVRRSFERMKHAGKMPPYGSN